MVLGLILIPGVLPSFISRSLSITFIDIYRKRASRKRSYLSLSILYSVYKLRDILDIAAYSQYCGISLSLLEGVCLLSKYLGILYARYRRIRCFAIVA
jgi:hypothetical protein